MNRLTSLRDPLTGVYSRATLDERLQEELERANRYGHSLSLLVLDIDLFKSVNDAFGHTRGDQVLIELARRIVAITRSSDILFRFGGEEFVLLLPETDKAQGFISAEHILKEIKSNPFPGDPPLTISLSIGVSSYPEDSDLTGTLFEIADKRMMEAKRRGRGRVVAERTGESDTPIFAEVSRLSEREQALESLHLFLDNLRKQKQGVLVISGLLGAGRTRFLLEVANAAKLRGYYILSVIGSEERQQIPFGALSDALIQKGEPPVQNIETRLKHYRKYLEKAGKKGLFITLDNLSEIDPASLNVITSLFQKAKVLRLGIAYSREPGQIEQDNLGILPHTQSTIPSAFSIPLHRTISLEPLSEDGLRVWLRSLLRWEPSHEFVSWLHQESHGLPGFAHKGLSLLIERGILERESGSWRVSQNFSQVSLQNAFGIPQTSFLHNLPIKLTDLVGREEEREQAKAVLRRGRLVTIVGPGGVGKTRLALHIATECLPYFAQGVYFVPLASISSPQFFFSTVAEVLKFTFYTNEDQKSQFINYLRGKEMLLILDNFEHLLSIAGILTEILQNVPEVKFLVTSRERLNLRGEWVLNVQGLSYPAMLPDEQTIADFESYSAIQLFLQSAQRIDANFAITDSDKPHILRICQLVEGLPLALELAAAWIKILSPQEIADEIEKSFDFLRTTWKDVPERHRSLRAVWGYSWKLLTKQEQQVFRKLSIFRGGFSRDAAYEVAGASLPILSALADQSLLRRHGSDRNNGERSTGERSNGERYSHDRQRGERYEMHEALKQYAHEKLAKYTDEAQKVRESHCEYFALFLQQREKALKNGQGSQILESVAREIENVRIAWHYAIEQGAEAQIERFTDSLFWFYQLRSWFQEGAETFARAAEELSKQQPLPDYEQNGRVDPVPQVSAISWKALARYGIFCYHLGRYDHAEQLLQQSLTQFRALGDLSEVAFSLTGLAHIAVGQGAYDEAQQLYEEAFAIYKELIDQFGIARVLENLGFVALQKGDYPVAKHYLEQALSLAKNAHLSQIEADSMRNLGGVLYAQGSYNRAREYYEEAFSIYREIGDRNGEGWTLNNLGVVYAQEGSYHNADRRFEEALLIHRDTGERQGQASTLGNAGMVAIAKGRYIRARAYFKESLEIYENLDYRRGRGVALNTLGLGIIHLNLGLYPSSKEYLQEALHIYQLIEDQHDVSEVYIYLSHLARQQCDSGLCYAKEALRIATSVGDNPRQAAALNALGEALANTGEWAQAIDAHQQALELRNSLGQPHLIMESRAALACLFLTHHEPSLALGQVEEILRHLEVQPLEGTLEPLRIYLICYQVLTANRDPRAADILNQAYNLLQAQVVQITEPSERNSFLVNVQTNRAIVDAYRQQLRVEIVA